MIGSNDSKSGFVELGDSRIYYEERGHGRPVVLIHAGIADSRMWDPQFDVLATSYRAIRYDMRGFGRTECGAGAFRDWKDLDHIFSTLEIEPAVLVGASMGAKVAAELALERPDLVRGLILTAPGLFPGTPPSDTLAAGWKEMEEAFEANDRDQMLEIELQMWVDGPRRTPDQVNANVRNRVREMNARAYQLEDAASGREKVSPPAVERLAELHAPTLVVVGAEDQPDILEIANRLETEIHIARKVVIDDAAHTLTMERPDVFNDLMLEFLEELTTRDAL